MRIPKLTPELEALFPIKREEWIKVGLSTEPADRERAERGVCLAYKAAGLKPLKQIIWVDSPLAGCYAATALNRIDKYLGKNVCEQVDSDIENRILDIIYYQGVEQKVWSLVWDEIYTKVFDKTIRSFRLTLDKIWEQFWEPNRNEISYGEAWQHLPKQNRGQSGYEVWKQFWGKTRAQAGYVSHHSAHGHHFVSDFAVIDFYSAVFPKIAKPLQGVMEVARSAGWWWPFENAVVISERPVELHLDPEGRLHNTEGMALRYPDGFGFWAIDGEGGYRNDSGAKILYGEEICKPLKGGVDDNTD